MKIARKKRLIINIYTGLSVLLSFSTLLAPSAVFATTPTITNITGSVATGQALTISGSSLMDEDSSNWDGFFSPTVAGFEGANWSTDGYKDGWGCGATSLSYDRFTKLMGTSSLRTNLKGYSWHNSDGTGNAGCRYSWKPVSTNSDIYLRAYSRWRSNEWPTQFIKYWRISDDKGVYPIFLNLIQNGGKAPTSIGLYSPAYNGGKWAYGAIPGGPIQQDKWYLIELHLRRNGSSPYVAEVWIDNKLIISTTGTHGAYGSPLGWESNTNQAGTTANYISDHWQDGFVMSSSRVGPASLIEIGNSPNYASTTKIYQSPTYISDGAVTVTADLTSLGAGPYYLWVTNSRGERSAPYQLDAGTVGSAPNDTVTEGNSSSTILFSETFDDASLNSRAWYDNIAKVAIDPIIKYSGNGSAKFRFAVGATTPDSGGALRRKFTPTDSVYVSYYVKYSDNWTGSNKTYHPHEFFLLTNQDSDWAGMASTHLTAYIEQNEGVPLFALQDELNIDQSKISVDLTKTTENRAVAGCNGSGDRYIDGSCYTYGTRYTNSKHWRASNVYFQDSQGPYYKGDWHHIEAFFRLNSIVGGIGQPDGVMQYWYDGVKIMDYKDVLFRTGTKSTMKFNQFIIAPYIGDGSPVDQTFWVDNLTLGTSPPEVSFSKLSAPTGLRIININ